MHRLRHLGASFASEVGAAVAAAAAAALRLPDPGASGARSRRGADQPRGGKGCGGWLGMVGDKKRLGWFWVLVVLVLVVG